MYSQVVIAGVMRLILLHLKALIYVISSCRNQKLSLVELIDYQITSNNYWRLSENPNSAEKRDKISVETLEAQQQFKKQTKTQKASY